MAKCRLWYVRAAEETWRPVFITGESARLLQDSARKSAVSICQVIRVWEMRGPVIGGILIITAAFIFAAHESFQAPHAASVWGLYWTRDRHILGDGPSCLEDEAGYIMRARRGGCNVSREPGVRGRRTVA